MTSEQNTKATVFQHTGTLYVLWLSLKMNLSTSFQLVLSKIVKPCHIASPRVRGTCYPCSTIVDTSQFVSCWFSKTISSTCAVFTCPSSAGLKVQSLWWMSIHLWKPCTLSLHDATSVHHRHTPTSTGSEFEGWKYSPYKNCVKPQSSAWRGFQYHYHWASTYFLNSIIDWLFHHLLHVTSITVTIPTK